MTSMAKLREIMTDLDTVGDPDARVRAIYRHGALDGAEDALKQAKRWCPSCFQTAPPLKKIARETANAVVERLKG